MEEDDSNDPNNNEEDSSDESGLEEWAQSEEYQKIKAKMDHNNTVKWRVYNSGLGNRRSGQVYKTISQAYAGHGGHGGLIPWEDPKEVAKKKMWEKYNPKNNKRAYEFMTKRGQELPAIPSIEDDPNNNNNVKDDPNNNNNVKPGKQEIKTPSFMKEVEMLNDPKLVRREQKALMIFSDPQWKQWYQQLQDLQNEPDTDLAQNNIREQMNGRARQIVEQNGRKYKNPREYWNAAKTLREIRKNKNTFPKDDAMYNIPRQDFGPLNSAKQREQGAFDLVAKVLIEKRRKEKEEEEKKKRKRE